MEKHHKFSIWYVVLGIWIVLITQSYLAATFSIRTIPCSEFLNLLKVVASGAAGRSSII